MNGYRMSYLGVFGDPPDGAPRINRIEIPIIQRDYAQGRPDAKAQGIRTTFLGVLLDAVAGGEPVGLDFIYGKVADGVLQPLDGQQRLTTLFLIHWYVASLADVLTTDADVAPQWTRLTYATRQGARHFCTQLVKRPLPHGLIKPSAWLQDQPWYLHIWRNDPTIESMLVVIDAIHEGAQARGLEQNAVAAWQRLEDPAAPPIYFYLLSLVDIESEEDLYIKMNSRGKPLTEFENLKAHLEEVIRHQPRAESFEQKIDGPWTNLMWEFRGDDDLVDDEFVRLLDFITEICDWRDGRTTEGRLPGRAEKVFGDLNEERADEHLAFLFDVFDTWGHYASVRGTFESTFSLDVPGSAAYDPGKVRLFDRNTVNLFEQCCRVFESRRDGNRPFTLQESLLFYAVLLCRIERTEDFPRRIRVLRNLLAASGSNEIRNERMPELLREVEHIIRTGELKDVKRLSTNQVRDELAKQDFVQRYPDLVGVIHRLEDHELLRGRLSVFDLDPDRLEGRATAFEAAFEPERYLDLTGALLATGDYQRASRRGWWQFGTADPKAQLTWRLLLTQGTEEDLAPTREFLGRLLDGIAGSTVSLDDHLNSVIDGFLAEQEREAWFDWRYYLVKYPAMRGGRDERGEGKTGLYVGSGGELGYSMCMLRTERLSGYHRDPFLLQVWLSSGVGDAAKLHWFSGDANEERWLPLAGSSTALRCVADGFEIRGPGDDDLEARFHDVCLRRGATPEGKGRLMLRTPQVDRDGSLTDTTDRVVVGAALLRDLVQAGL